MLSLTGAMRIYLYRPSCDMRKSFDGLCGLIRAQLNQDPLSGSLFVFCNRRRNMVKMLYWDIDGLAIWYKRLEKGSFIIPRMRATDGSIERRELSLLLEGVVPKKVSRRYII